MFKVKKSHLKRHFSKCKQKQKWPLRKKTFAAGCLGHIFVWMTLIHLLALAVGNKWKDLTSCCEGNITKTKAAAEKNTLVTDRIFPFSYFSSLFQRIMSKSRKKTNSVFFCCGATAVCGWQTKRDLYWLPIELGNKRWAAISEAENRCILSYITFILHSSKFHWLTSHFLIW